MKQFSDLLTAKKMICLRIIGLAILFTVAATFSAVRAQTSFGQISGTVTDASGAIVPGANVTAIDPATNFTRSATTDENGFYTITNLPVATYSVAVEAINFKNPSSPKTP